MTGDHQIERFLEKILEVIARLSRLWKGLEDIGKALFDETVGVPVDKFVTLVKQFAGSSFSFCFIYPSTQHLENDNEIS